MLLYNISIRPACEYVLKREFVLGIGWFYPTRNKIESLTEFRSRRTIYIIIMYIIYNII